MSNVQVIFHSESGFTERYARWIAEDLGIACERLDNQRTPNVHEADDVLIIGSPVHGSELARKHDIERLVANAGQARVICFATCVSEPSDALAQRVARASLKNPGRVSMHALPGGFDEQRLDQAMSALLKALRFMLKHRRGITKEQQLLLDRTAVAGDYTDRAYTASIVREARDVKTEGFMSREELYA